MHYEQEAMERQNMLDKIKNLENTLRAMESDFGKCAHGISPCFYCANDSICSGCAKDCNFVWDKHN